MFARGPNAEGNICFQKFPYTCGLGLWLFFLARKLMKLSRVVKSFSRGELFSVQLNSKVLGCSTSVNSEVVYLYSLFLHDLKFLKVIVQCLNSHYKSPKRFKAFLTTAASHAQCILPSVSEDKERSSILVQRLEIEEEDRAHFEMVLTISQRDTGTIIKWKLANSNSVFWGRLIKILLSWRSFGFCGAAALLIMTLVTLQNFCAYYNVHL